MSEFLIESQILARKLFPESSENRYGKTVIIKNPENKVFLGLLVKDSVIIPVGIKEPAEDTLRNIVNINKGEITPNSKENAAQNVAHSLGLPYNGQTYGLYSDGQLFSGVFGLHLYFYDYHESQQKFVTKMSDVLSSLGVKVSILED